MDMMNDLHHNCFSLNDLPSTSANPKKRRSKLARSPTPKSSRKPDPSAPKITRPCSECGKKFWSWKALFGHMRCHPDRQWRGINPPPNLRAPPPETTEEDREVAACLLILANQECCSRKACIVKEEDGEGHKCSVCLRVFSSGQALGGHKRCHREIINPSSSSSRALINCNLDLNLPFPHDNNHDHDHDYGSPNCGLDLRLGL